MDENEYKKELEESGVDITPEPEVKDKFEEDDSEDVQPEDQKSNKSDEEPEKDSKDENDDDTTDDDDEDLDEKPEAPKKRSIYKDFKENKKSLKEERRLRAEAEERTKELEERLNNLENADTEKDTDEALTELEEYAKEIDADPEALKKLQSILLKNAPKNDELASKLAKFEEWQKDNASVLEENRFNKEFDSNVDSIKEIIPKASQSEMKEIKDKIKELSKTEEFADKDLDFIAFKNKKILSALVSPRKGGLESKDNVDSTEAGDNYEFNPNADLTKLSPTARAKWEEAYNKASNSEDILKDSEGRMSIL